MKPPDPNDDQGHEPADRYACLQASERILGALLVIIFLAGAWWLGYELLELFARK